jgi:TatD DNase family protein
VVWEGGGASAPPPTRWLGWKLLFIQFLGWLLEMIVDSHCHLDDERLAPIEAQVVARAQEAGVTRMITIGTDENTSAAAAAIASRHPRVVWHTVGAHPNEADRMGEAEWATIERLARETKPVGFGEIGLDFHYETSRHKQYELFVKSLALARELNLPVVIHDRDAHDEILKVMAEKAEGLRILLHCYSAGAGRVEDFLELGCYFSIAGPVTFKNGQDVRDAAMKIPLDRLMVETDAPYLTPHPHRGKLNEPAFTRFTAEKLAEVKGVSLEEFARVTTQTTVNFFGLAS